MSPNHSNSHGSLHEAETNELIPSRAHSSYYNSYSIPSKNFSSSISSSCSSTSNHSNLPKSFVSSSASPSLLMSISNGRTAVESPPQSSSSSSSNLTKVGYFDRYPERKNQGPYVLDSKLTTTPSSSSRRREKEREREKEKEKEKGKLKEREGGERHKRASNQTTSNSTTSASTRAVSDEKKERDKERERERERGKEKDRSIGRKEGILSATPASSSSLGHGLGITSMNLSSFSSLKSKDDSSESGGGEERPRTYSIAKHREQANAAAFKSPSGYPSAPSSLTKRHSKKDLRAGGSHESSSESGNGGMDRFSSNDTPPTISEERFNSSSKTPTLSSRAGAGTSGSSSSSQAANDAKLYAALRKDLGISEPSLKSLSSSSSSRKLRSAASTSSVVSSKTVGSHSTSRRNQNSSFNEVEEQAQIRKASSRANGLNKSTSSYSISNRETTGALEESELSTSGSNFLSSLSRSYSSSNSLTPMPGISPNLPFPRSPGGPSPDSSPSKPKNLIQTSSTPSSSARYQRQAEPVSPTRSRTAQKRSNDREPNLDLNSNRTSATTLMTRLEAPKSSSTSQASSSPRSDEKRLSTYSGYSLSSTGTASSYGEPPSPSPLFVQVDTSWWDGVNDKDGFGRNDSKGSINSSLPSPHHLNATKIVPATYAASSAALGKSKNSSSSSASSRLKTEYVPSIDDILRSHSKLPVKSPSQAQMSGSNESRLGAVSPNSLDFTSSSRESSIYEGLGGSGSSSSNNPSRSQRSNPARSYQMGGKEGSWGSRSLHTAKHGAIPEYGEVKNQIPATPNSDQDLEPSDSDDGSISSAGSVEREIRESLKNERRKNKMTLNGKKVSRPELEVRSHSAGVDANSTLLSGGLDLDRSTDSPVMGKRPSKALHHATSFPNRRILSKGSKSPPSPLKLNGISSFTGSPASFKSKGSAVILGKGLAGSERGSGSQSPSAPHLRRRAVSTASTASARSAALAASSTTPMPSMEDGSTVAHYLRSTRLTRLVKLVQHPNDGVTVSLADVGAPEGHPVVIFLGLGAVRYLAALYDEMAVALNLRLICIDRWGLGRTTDVPSERRGLLDWASVVNETTSQMGIDKFSVLAHSAGAPYAMATVLLYPNRIAGPAHLLAPWVNSTHESGYKWLKYVPDTVIKTAQAAEWKMQGWKLGKNPSLSYEAVGSDGLRSSEGFVGTPNSDSFSVSSIENPSNLEILSSPALTSCSSGGHSPTSPNLPPLCETPLPNRTAKGLKGKPSFLGGFFNGKNSVSGHAHSSSGSSARMNVNRRGSQASLVCSPLASQDSDPLNHWTTSKYSPADQNNSASKDTTPVATNGRAASSEIPRVSLADDLNLSAALFKFNEHQQDRTSSSIDGHTLSGSFSLASGLVSSRKGVDSDPSPLRRSISTSDGLPRLPSETFSFSAGMPTRGASASSISTYTNADTSVSSAENSSSISSLGNNVFITPQMKQGGWAANSGSSPLAPSVKTIASSTRSTSTAPGTPSSFGTPVSQSSKTFNSNTSTPTSSNAPADLTTALLRASHAESLKGGTADLMAILGRGSRPWGFTFSDVQHPVKVWHGDRDEKISLTGVMWMEREMENCEVKIVKGAGHSLMTNVAVFVEALER